MKNTLKTSKLNTAIIATLALMLTSSLFLVLSLPSAVNASSASAGANISDAGYGDLMQYEWRAYYGNDGAGNWFSKGPAPDSFDLNWRVGAVGSASGRYYPAAFNGKVFIYSGNRLQAIDGVTGATAWNNTYRTTGVNANASTGSSLSVGNPMKIDATHAVAGSVCFNPNDGSMYWYATSAPTVARPNVNATFATSSSFTSNSGIYSVDLKLYFTGNRAWNMSDITKPPFIQWDNSYKADQHGLGQQAYGDGVLMGSANGYANFWNATTGEVIANTAIQAPSYKNMYYDGIYYHNGYDRKLIALDVHTGEILWT
jgi:hypothetical protein